MEVLGAATTVITIVELTAKLGSLCLDYGRAVKNSATEINELKEAVEAFKNVAEEVRLLLEKPEGQELKQSKSLDVVLKQSHTKLKELEQKLEPKELDQHPGPKHKAKRRKLSPRALKWPFQREEVNGLIGDIQKYNETISHIFQVHQTNLLHELCLKTVLDTLPIANEASFDSHDERHNAVCLPGTRKELLSDIKTWASNPFSKSLFWLNGVAGTGKSTISRTICRDFEKCSQLGASFFFKRGEGDRGNLLRFVTTLATQLSERHPDFAQSIRTTIDADKSIVRKGPKDQFEKLIKGPLAKIRLGSQKRPFFVFVIDALDECDNDDDIKLIINLFSSCGNVTSPNMKLKWLITSRPDLPIRLGFSAVQGTFQDFVLHEIPPSFVERDISAFLKHELDKIKTEYNSSVFSDRQLPSYWPGAQSFRALVAKAIPLFIFAATICRLLNNRRFGSPEDLLEQILDFQSDEQSSLEATYMPVLNNLTKGLADKPKRGVIETFRAIVGPILILASPLTTIALADLLDIPKRKIDGQLDLLHSVLDVPATNELPVRLFHLSFRDFLIDPEKQAKVTFWVDEKESHRSLGQNCLRIMNKHLRQDICQLILPGTRCADIESNSIKAHLPSQLQYACLYWVSHIEKGEILLDDNSNVLRFLREHLLHWLEAMSLIGRAPESLKMLRTLQTVLKREESRDLQAFLQDALRVVRTNLPTITSTPLQIYSSILAFSPKNSLVRQMFEQKIPKWILLKPQTNDGWDQCEQILEGHSELVTSVAFSPNGQLVASASYDKTVQLWRSDDGTCVQELTGHTDRVNSVALSSNSQLVASASSDKTVRLWRTDDGTCVQELNGHTSWVKSVSFSPDGQLVASASDDKTVRLWRSDDGTCIQELKGHTDRVSSVALSPDGQLVASASHDGTVRLWQGNDGTCVQELNGHTNWVNAVAFSPDSRLVASASNDKTVRLWRIDDGTCIQELKGHTDRVSYVTLSPDGQLVASASHDGTVRLWRGNDGTCVQELKGHTNWVNAVAFSPDGQLVASASTDKMIRLWRSYDGTCMKERKGHTDWVNFVAFSPDGRFVVSASSDTSVRLWRTDDGNCVQELKGHTKQLTCVVFSSDGKHVASASTDNTVRFWRSDDGTCVQELQGHTDWVNFVAFSPDGKHVASTSTDNTVRFWRSDDGTCVQELKGHTDWVNYVAFSPDGKHVASASHDKTVRLWRSDDGTCVQELQGHTDWVNFVAFSPDGKHVASASLDKTVRLWRGDDGSCVQKLEMYTRTLKFDPLGAFLITDRGVLDVSNRPSINPTTSPSLAENLSGANISSDRCWILWENIPILWIPVSFRGYSSLVDGSTVATGTRSGRVIIMRFGNLEFLTGAM